jgi:large subunit ribosomal protein L19
MISKLTTFTKSQIKKEAPDIRSGDIVRVFLKLPEKTKRGGEKIQAFEGLVIARKHGKGINSTFTVRKISDGIGVERIFPIFCPSITKIEILKRSKTRRAKLYYMRDRAGKKARMKTKELLGVEWESPKEEKAKKKPKEENLKPPQESLDSPKAKKGPKKPSPAKTIEDK